MSVIVAWMSDGTVTHDFCRSLANTIQAEPDRIAGMIALPSGPNLSASRNKVARMFLDTDAEWLWMVDADMKFPHDTLARMLTVADSEETPILGALCFGQRHTADRLEYFTTMFSRDDSGGVWRLEDYPAETLLTLDATGTGCLMVHRTVFETVAEHYPEPLQWFAEEVNEWGALNSEDVTFCFRARKCGFPVKVHTGIKVGHVKPRVVDESVYQDWRASHGE